MNICSLLPSATEILYSLDLGDEIVAVTHECDYPPKAESKTRITRSVIDHSRLTSAEIDHHVTSNIGRHGSIYNLDEQLLEALQPDLIVTQELCDVCAVSYKEVQHAARVLDGRTRIVSLEPNTLDDVFDTVLLVGRITGREQAAHEKIREWRARVNVVRRRVQGLNRPKVYAMEWLDPPFSGGHWVPEMVEIAGGHEVLGKAGEKSERITVERVLEADPEIVVLMPCGFSLEKTIDEYRRTSIWGNLPAPKARVYAVDGSSYFNRPGPRLVDGIEILADIFIQGVAMNRIEILKGFLKENPNDSFSRYALALEYVKLEQNDDAVREFETVKTNDPDYVATYFQLGQLYQKIGRSHDAEKTFRTGITLAAKIRDDHTRSELESALESLTGNSGTVA